MSMTSNEPPEREPSRRDGRISRRAFAGGAAAVTGLSVLGHWTTAPAADASVPAAALDRLGSVSTAPRLGRAFKRTFTSRFVWANGIRQHAVVGGDGPPLLLVHGWPQNWYAWRFLMPSLARRYTVIAPDQRGIGLSRKADAGYDSATLGDDLAALMTELGHERFAVVGHDTGYLIGYALAADHRDRVERLAVAELPGPPGVPDDPSLYLPEPGNNKVWHIPFNRVDDELIVDMVHSHADAYYRYEFAIQAGGATLPDYAINYYVKLYNRNKRVLRATFGLYRAWDAHLKQNKERMGTKLTIPVLGIGGANSWGARAGQGLERAASDVRTVVIPRVGHWVAETAPEQMLEALVPFLEPYRVSLATRR